MKALAFVVVLFVLDVAVFGWRAAGLILIGLLIFEGGHALGRRGTGPVQ